MTPTTTPHQPDNKPQRIVLSFITAVFIIAAIVFAMGTYKACKPPVVQKVDTVVADSSWWSPGQKGIFFKDGKAFRAPAGQYHIRDQKVTVLSDSQMGIELQKLDSIKPKEGL